MPSIDQVLNSFKQATLPLLDDLKEFLSPFATVLPDRRYGHSLLQFVPGMLAARSPQVSQAAAHAPEREGSSWSLAKCIYRLLSTPEHSHRAWLKPLYADARRVAQAAEVPRVLVALDPINFEEPYGRKLEYLSRVWKSTPPGSLTDRRQRITHGYPAVLAYTVNLPQPTIPYARWFSYTSPEFVSENMELRRAVRTVRTVLTGKDICFIADAGLDDQKFFEYCGAQQVEFIIRAAHDRWVEVFNARLNRWEPEHLKDLVDTVPGCLGFVTSFTHAGKVVQARVILDWLQIRIPETQQILWIVVAQTQGFPDPLVLFTNRSVTSALEAQQVYRDWRYRPMIEHLYRFIQEDGLDVEEIQVQTLERQRRTFVLVLVAALFVLRVPGIWRPETVAFLRALGSSTAGTHMDRQGPYEILIGLHRVLSTLSLLSCLARRADKHIGSTSWLPGTWPKSFG
jgi:hypothetical protein